MLGSALRNATANSAEEATCACTPTNRSATSTADRAPAPDTNCLRSRQANTCSHVTRTRSSSSPDRLEATGCGRQIRPTR
ncbi:Uncharacterised protein [Mycobacteroides abscessus subsp. abscessus]|nr:Uncharacterised protein [Mycobacteroides abscessus subsp. abscessus]